MKKFSQNLFSQFKKYIATNDLVRAGDKIVIACSGGSDSVALLFLLNELAKEMKLELIVAHYNHKLRGREADGDGEFVKNLSESMKLKFMTSSANNKIKSEEQAREQRYEFLEKARVEERAKLVAVGHNLNDLAETVLLNIIRGAGIRGLYSLRPKRGLIVRPLLFAEKSDILSYLSKRKINYRADKSNKSMVYTRNIMRHIILPEIKKINPAALSAIARTSLLASQADEYIVSSSTDTLSKISQNDNGKILIDRKKFSSLSPAIQSEIIRILARQFGIDKDLTFSDVDEVRQLAEKNIGKKFKIIRSMLKFEIKSGRIVIHKLK